MDTKAQATERIRFMTEMLRLAWLSALAATTGTFGLLLGEFSARRLVFIVLGIVTIAGFVLFMAHLRRRIETAINDFPED